MPHSDLRERLGRALHPITAVPDGTPWNQAELDDLLPTTLMPAAVLVGIVAHAEPTLIFTRRTDDLKNHAGQISFPGGRVDPQDRDATAAALREAEEEIGLAATRITPLGFLDPYVTITGFRVLPLVAWVEPGDAYRPHPREVAEVFEAPLSFLLRADNAQYHRREFRGRERGYHVISWQGRDIWGATAAMIVNLRARFEAVTSA